MGACCGGRQDTPEDQTSNLPSTKMSLEGKPKDLHEKLLQLSEALSVLKAHFQRLLKQLVKEGETPGSTEDGSLVRGDLLKSESQVLKSQVGRKDVGQYFQQLGELDFGFMKEFHEGKKQDKSPEVGKQVRQLSTKIDETTTAFSSLQQLLDPQPFNKLTTRLQEIDRIFPPVKTAYQAESQELERILKDLDSARDDFKTIILPKEHVKQWQSDDQHASDLAKENTKLKEEASSRIAAIQQDLETSKETLRQFQLLLQEEEDKNSTFETFLSDLAEGIPSLTEPNEDLHQFNSAIHCPNTAFDPAELPDLTTMTEEIVPKVVELMKRKKGVIRGIVEKYPPTAGEWQPLEEVTHTVYDVLESFIVSEETASIEEATLMLFLYMHGVDEGISQLSYTLTTVNHLAKEGQSFSKFITQLLRSADAPFFQDPITILFIHLLHGMLEHILTEQQPNHEELWVDGGKVHLCTALPIVQKALADRPDIGEAVIQHLHPQAKMSADDYMKLRVMNSMALQEKDSMQLFKLLDVDRSNAIELEDLVEGLQGSLDLWIPNDVLGKLLQSEMSEGKTQVSKAQFTKLFKMQEYRSSREDDSLSVSGLQMMEALAVAFQIVQDSS